MFAPSVEMALDECRAQLLEHARVGGDLTPLRKPVGALCRAARRERMTPERLLVAVKQVLREVPALASVAPEQADEVRSEIITCVISSYFPREATSE